LADFQKWTKDEIVGIISSMKEVLKPEDLPAGSQLILEQTNTQLEITRPYPKYSRLVTILTHSGK
jgi:hypothetical protein